MTIFWKAFTWTAIPIVALSILSTAASAGEVSGSALRLGFYLVYGAAGVWLVTTMAMVVLYTRGKRESAPRVLAGVSVGVLALGTTGLVIFATVVVTFR